MSASNTKGNPHILIASDDSSLATRYTNLLVDESRVSVADTSTDAMLFIKHATVAIVAGRVNSRCDTSRIDPNAQSPRIAKIVVVDVDFSLGRLEQNYVSVFAVGKSAIFNNGGSNQAKCRKVTAKIRSGYVNLSPCSERKNNSALI